MKTIVRYNHDYRDIRTLHSDALAAFAQAICQDTLNDSYFSPMPIDIAYMRNIARAAANVLITRGLRA